MMEAQVLPVLLVGVLLLQGVLLSSDRWDGNHPWLNAGPLPCRSAGRRKRVMVVGDRSYRKKPYINSLNGREPPFSSRAIILYSHLYYLLETCPVLPPLFPLAWLCACRPTAVFFKRLFTGLSCATSSRVECDTGCRATWITSSMRSTGTKVNSRKISRGTSSRSFILRFGNINVLMPAL